VKFKKAYTVGQSNTVKPEWRIGFTELLRGVSLRA
jgi:hypothetical protein